MKTPLKSILLRLGLILLILLLFPATYLSMHYFKNRSQAQQVSQPSPVSTTQVQTSDTMFELHHWTTAEGTEVVFAPLHELPIIDIQIVYAAGSAYDGDKFGTAQLMSDLIGEDTQDLTSESIHEAFESVGALFHVALGRDALNISLRTLAEQQHSEAALNTLSTILGQTTFTQPAFQREKDNLLNIINSDKQNPTATISDAYYQALYGEHPYAHPTTGTVETVTALTLEDIQHFHRKYFVKQNAIVAITGDLTLEQAQTISNKLVTAMASGEAAPAIPPIPEPQNHNKIIAFPSSQTHLMMGIPAIAKGNPDFFALSVGNQILGVTPLVNRLFNIVREQQGLAYNVGSALTTLKQPGPFTIYLQTRASEADKALALVNETLSSYLKTGPSETELQDAKNNLYGQFALSLSNNAAITSHIATLAFYDLPWDYQDHYRANINAVTLEDVKDVFSRYIHPEAFSLIRLGEAS